MVSGCHREEIMTMSDQMQGGMAEAMRLMQEGELAEATAVIQRTLGGSSLGSEVAPADSPDAPSSADEVIDVESSVVEEASHPGAASRPAAGRGLGAAPRPDAAPLLFGSLPLTMPDGLTLTMPDSMPLTMPGGFPGLPGTMPSPKEGETNPAVVPAGGRFVERSYTNQTGTRSYKLYIPSGYIGQEVPL